MLSRMIDQHAGIMRRGGEVSHPQRNRARRQGEGVTQRQCVTGCLRLFNAHFGSAHRLIRKPLQPQHPRKERARRHVPVNLEANDILEANDVTSMIGGGIMSQHLLEMAPRTDLVAKIMFGHAHHVFAEQLSAKVRPTRCQIMELLRKWQRSTVSTARGVKEI